MRTVLLVPRRGHPERDKLWAWCRERWEKYLPDLTIYEGHHDDGPFNRSAAINTASRLADEDGPWDLAIVIDGDVFLRASQVRKAIQTASRTGKVTWAHRRWRGLAEDHTKRVINPRNPIDFGPEVDRDDMDVYVERTNPLSWSCCVVIPRKVWDDIGGFDERFEGWGYEDMAWQSLIKVYGWERIKGDVYHLWHPRSGERIVKGEPAETASAEYVTNARLGRRYMIAQYRDHGIGDEGEMLSDEVRARHVSNLKRDDARLVQAARRFNLPDWSDWWPTLEELRAGAVAHHAGPPPTVTVILHTGGEPETWEERSAYLRLSLASFSEMVTGPIVQRVLYSDWGPDHDAELRTIAESHGFYVAGEGHHGYTGSMQRMWRYIARRAQGSYIFGTEDDFTFTRPVDLDPMIATLRDNPSLAQLALLRDAYYQDERETGGILGWPEPAFTSVGHNGTSRLEHRLFWTENPHLFRKTLTSKPWPSGHHSETQFGKLLLGDPRTRFAFWGSGEEWVKHIGAVRAGSGY